MGSKERREDASLSKPRPEGHRALGLWGRNFTSFWSASSGHSLPLSPPQPGRIRNEKQRGTNEVKQKQGKKSPPPPPRALHPEPTHDTMARNPADVSDDETRFWRAVDSMPWPERVRHYFKELAAEKERQRANEDIHRLLDMDLSRGLDESTGGSELSRPLPSEVPPPAKHWAWRATRRGTEFHGFMWLPVEIRSQIYEYLLVVGRHYVPLRQRPICPAEHRVFSRYELSPHVTDGRGDLYQRYHDWYAQGCGWHDRANSPDNPFTIGLLKAVSRQVQAEADRIFWGQNQFIFPVGWYEYYPNYLITRSRGLRHVWNKHAKDVSFAFHKSDTSYYHGDRRSLEDKEPEHFRDPLTAREFLHNRGKEQLGDCWQSTCNYLQRSTALKRLQVDLTDCYCPLGCCRMVQELCGYLAFGRLDYGEERPEVWERQIPDTFEIIGWRDNEEKELIVRVLAEGLSIEPSRIVCIPYITPPPRTQELRGYDLRFYDLRGYMSKICLANGQVIQVYKGPPR
ncbi:hypothetical protein GGR56DRAFT_215989 [Xylariaceae sp. FL0804]|nr:hypothetical protein GGR56DRAFT_215989 [Xylariaceae sp. FL0804]